MRLEPSSMCLSIAAIWWWKFPLSVVSVETFLTSQFFEHRADLVSPASFCAEDEVRPWVLPAVSSTVLLICPHFPKTRGGAESNCYDF